MDIDPEMAHPYVVKGNILTKAQRHDESLEAYQAALDVCDRRQPENEYQAKFSLYHCSQTSKRSLIESPKLGGAAEPGNSCSRSGPA